MTTKYHITDTPLPDSQNFKVLKELGLQSIQQASGNQWTNFNAGDPGVTILDQLCYALTELGYCVDFPIEDILTKEDGKLAFENQFFDPENLLTSAPITKEDYIRLLVDEIKEIDNAVIIPLRNNSVPIQGLYETYLMLNPKATTSEHDLCEAAFLQLNSLRCNGELFLLPKVLAPVNYQLFGTVSLRNLKELKTTFGAIDLAIRQLIFPSLVAKGYDQWVEEGKTINDIYDGPQLKNGWIPTSEFVDKKDQITTAQISATIQSIDSVNAASITDFLSPTPAIEPIVVLTKTAVSTCRQLITFNPLADLKGGRLQIILNGKLLSSDSDLKRIKKILDTSTTQALKKTTAKKSTLHTKPSVPVGKYRDIEGYYSIQNTMPEIYGVGEHAIDKNASEYKMALSKQLKAYLTFFDQVMANELSQLANLDQLLSFKNTMTNDPVDEKNFYSTKDQFQKENLQYPVPYLSFSPTYFCQSLYDAPGIRQLLKQYNAFNFGTVITPQKERDHDSWEEYQDSPYNGYIYGLIEGMEHQQIALERRNQFLNHLLARHGQSPELIDAIIADSVYSGDSEQDQVIFKSLYLQNFALLNYYAQSASDFLGTDPLVNACPLILPNEVNRLQNEVSTDFLFNTETIDDKEALNSHLFRNYSGIQLKFFLLLGVRTLYRYFILEQSSEELGYAKLISQAYWFMQHRGAIFIETNLLAVCAKYEIVIREKVKSKSLEPTTYQYWKVSGSFTIKQFQALEQALSIKGSIDNAVKVNELNIDDKNYSITKVGAVTNTVFRPLNDSGYELSYTATLGNQKAETGQGFLKNSIRVFVPDFIDAFLDHSFQHRLDLLMDSSLSTHVDYQLFPLPPDLLTTFIPAYINWYNSLRYEDGDNNADQLFESAKVLKASSELIEAMHNVNEQKVEKK